MINDEMDKKKLEIEQDKADIKVSYLVWGVNVMRL